MNLGSNWDSSYDRTYRKWETTVMGMGIKLGKELGLEWEGARKELGINCREGTEERTCRWNWERIYGRYCEEIYGIN